jgi:putative ABC transport system substrate-binding protein
VRPCVLRLAAVVAVLLLSAPVASEAQQTGKVPRIGVLSGFSNDDPCLEALRSGLGELGYVEGGGLLVLPSGTTSLYRHVVVGLAARYRLPAVYPFHFYVNAGGLMSYSTDLVDQSRQAASYVDRILRGATPGELPVQSPTKYVTTVNLKTANALGLTIPPSLLARADQVIE